ncbi:hypothetical protein C0Q70_04644 [Pomacea canaliculata]|uniref:Cytochrome P450 n=1 Tax=Pomacea canaliculata TaxID=400727 RepID=A0A2T7PIY9_POMCA|nr:hypothetical protein C0Q70_04644 [Pomacea canaliculata]
MDLQACAGIIETDLKLVAEFGRLVGIFHAREPVLLISDPDMIKQICVKEFSNFTNRKNNGWPGRVLSHAVSALEDDHWKHARSVLSPTFSSGKMRNIVPLIQHCLDHLLEAVKKQGENGKSIEVRKIVECFTMDTIAMTQFGMDVDPHNNPEAGFVKNAKTAMSYVTSPILMLCALFPFMYYFFRLFNISPMNNGSQAFFYMAVSSAIKERTKENKKRTDLLQLMLDAHKENPVWEDDLDPDSKLEYNVFKGKGFTEEEILANSLVFMLAGYDTTSSLLTFACHSLAVHPACQSRLREEISSNLGQAKPTYDNVFGLKYLDCVVNETLRMYPPAARFSRMATEAITIKGVTIPAGMSVHFPLYAIHHDPEFWTDPETFNPDRFDRETRTWPAYAFVPFGAGPRNCVGMRLALLEAKMALVALIQHFNIEAAPDTEVKPKLEKGGFIRPLNPLYLKFVAHLPHITYDLQLLWYHDGEAENIS